VKISIETGNASTAERTLSAVISPDELAAAYLHLACPQERNRTWRFMRRHRRSLDEVVDPNRPVRLPEEEPDKLTIPQHLKQMRDEGTIPRAGAAEGHANLSYAVEPAMFVLPISDLVANLLRPCFHSAGLGDHNLFHFQDEPIATRTYFCACFFREGDTGRLDMKEVRFDPETDRAFDSSGKDLMEEGLVWAAAVIPLVREGVALPASEIACNVYDLRQIFGRNAVDKIRYAYEGWHDQWDGRVTELLEDPRNDATRSSAFYHSILSLDDSGAIGIHQMEGDLCEISQSLQAKGVQCAGLLDSGGSCALYDVARESFLNHSWYYREPRGAVIVFQLTADERIPEAQAGSWMRRRKD